VARQVESAVTGPRLSRIQSLRSWEDKQDAVDALYEEVEAELKEKEPILGKHPSFGSWVDRALEEHLRSVVKGSSASDGADISRPLPAAGEGDDETALPVFMDCYDAAKDSESSVVPAVLSPLKVRASEAGGRMVEEWELAAHKASKRILLRQSTRDIARHMIEAEDGGDGSSSSSNGASKRILVHGRQGVGKTAALAAIVASARSSGCIVLYLPDGDNLHRHGFYVEPSARRPGIFDLPVLSQETCQHFLTSHQSDLSQFAASPDVLREFFTGDQLNQLGKVDGGLSLVEILKSGAAKTALAPMCFAVAIDVLTKQDKVPFWMVLDEFNCYFERSHYFHMDYDVDVKKPIPYDQISLLRPALRAMSLSVSGPLDDPPAPLAGPPAAEAIRRGGVLAGTSESRAIGRKVTDGLVENAAMQEAAGAASASSPIRVVEVPRLSSLEVDHVIANYEAVGVGKLRLDRGETVMNEQEMAYLRIVSGGVAQKLMDACIL
jgi:small subunit ribosomal protein S29